MFRKNINQDKYSQVLSQYKPVRSGTIDNDIVSRMQEMNKWADYGFLTTEEKERFEKLRDEMMRLSTSQFFALVLELHDSIRDRRKEDP